MSNRRHDDAAPAGAQGVAGRLRRGAGGALALGLLAGTAACSSAPQYPIYEGERAGNGTVMAVQPRYAVSAQDAAQNAADARAQGGYPAYGAPPMAEPAAPAPGASPYGDAPQAAPAPGADDMADDAPKALGPNGGGVDSADLPPPGAAPAASAGQVPPVPADPGAGAVPPADPAASPHEIVYAYGGGQVVFGTDWVVQPTLELAAYRHHRHAAAQSADSADETAEPSASRKRRRHGTAEESADAAPAESHAAAADTPYQTVVKPGETLGEVAERIHSSKAALTALNDLKHPRHVKPGTVLKIPYRYSYEVQKGDTLYTIAHRFNQEPTAIAKLNGLKAIPTLQPGQSIQLPPDASDQGKRDHASASGPEPVAAPEKVADAALRKVEKTERRSRRSRAAELNSAEASLPPQEIHHGRGRGEATASAQSSPPARPTGTVAASESGAIPPPVTPAETPPSRPATVAAAPIEAPRAAAPAPAVTRAYATTPAPASSYAGRAAVPGAGVAVVGGAALAATGGSALSRPSTVAPSTYVSPGYAARSAATAPAAGQYASVTPPRYTPGYPATGSSVASGATASPYTTSPYTPSLGRERPAAPALSGGAAAAGDIASAGRGRFIWPLRGSVVSGFGAKGTGEYNNGVDISAAPGAGVRAAASGDVVYAGSSIPGYGNMVLIKHPGGWVTAYAHLNRIEVRMHDTVSQGDEIGQAGQTGVVDRPELYFEVRYAASAADRPRPVDPALVLPAGGG